MNNDIVHRNDHGRRMKQEGAEAEEYTKILNDRSMPSDIQKNLPKRWKNSMLGLLFASPQINASKHLSI